MKIVYENLGVIIAFSLLIILVQNFISEKASESLLLITLVSVLLVNANKITDFFDIA